MRIRVSGRCLNAPVPAQEPSASVQPNGTNDDIGFCSENPGQRPWSQQDYLWVQAGLWSLVAVSAIRVKSSIFFEGICMKVAIVTDGDFVSEHF